MSKPKSKKTRAPAIKVARPRRERRVIPADQRFLTIDEAADDSTLSRRKLYRHLPEIGVLKIGKRTLVDRDRLHAWLRSHAQVA